jgi:hypothetical protein
VTLIEQLASFPLFEPVPVHELEWLVERGGRESTQAIGLLSAESATLQKERPTIVTWSTF